MKPEGKELGTSAVMFFDTQLAAPWTECVSELMADARRGQRWDGVVADLRLLSRAERAILAVA